MSQNESDRELVVTRTFDAPRALVWKAWTDPAHVGQWWGPNGFTTTTYESDVRPGGVWRYMMHGPDGTDYPNLVTFAVVEEPERLEYAHGTDDTVPELFRTTVLFEEAGGKTTITMRLLFRTREERDQIVEASGAVDGANQTLGRLAEYLETMAA